MDSIIGITIRYGMIGLIVNFKDMTLVTRNTLQGLRSGTTTKQNIGMLMDQYRDVDAVCVFDPFPRIVM